MKTNMKTKDWVFCDARLAIAATDFVVQGNEETLVGIMGGGGQLVIGHGKCGKVGELWSRGHFLGSATGVGLANMGYFWNEKFALEIEAAKGAARLFLGLSKAEEACISGNKLAVAICIKQAMERIDSL